MESRCLGSTRRCHSEILDGSEFDLTRACAHSLAISWTRSAFISGVLPGTPCSSWSCARHDPPGSALYNRVKHGVMYASQQQERSARRHRYDTMMEGVGIDRVTANFGRALVDDAVRVDDSESIAMARQLLERDGLFVGGSAAMNCVGAVRVARQLGPGHTIVTVLCDGGQRYLSTVHKPPEDEVVNADEGCAAHGF